MRLFLLKEHNRLETRTEEKKKGPIGCRIGILSYEDEALVGREKGRQNEGIGERSFVKWYVSSPGEVNLLKGQGRFAS